jgi:hypothetical protein
MKLADKSVAGCRLAMKAHEADDLACDSDDEIKKESESTRVSCS